MQRLQVLIAEEKDLVASRLAAQLEALGHRVLAVVRTSPAAVEFVRKTPPDLVFLGQHLPPYDGIEAARMIIAKRILPLVLLIGYPAASLVRRAQEAGVLAYLVWPAEARTLESTIEIAQTRFREFRVLYEHVGDLRQVLRTRMVVGRAKLSLMRRLGLAESDAFGYVLRQSRRTGTPLEEVAKDLALAEELWFGKPDLAGSVDAILRALTRSKGLGPSQVA